MRALSRAHFWPVLVRRVSFLSCALASKPVLVDQLQRGPNSSLRRCAPFRKFFIVKGPSLARHLGLVARARPGAFARAVGLGLLSMGSVGCAVEAMDQELEAPSDRVHGYLRIAERVGPSTERADALSVFVRFPDGAESPEVLSALGVHVRLPDAGLCSVAPRLAKSASPEAPPSSAKVELVLAELVSLRSDSRGAAAEQQLLVPHAFPTVGGTVGGALYTSRSRRAEDLPAGTNYTLSVQGLAETAENLKFSFRLPDRLKDVTVSGIALAELTELERGRPIDVTWTPDEAITETEERRVVVEIGDGAESARCIFPESDGSGTVPSSLLDQVLARPAPLTLSLLKLTRSRARGGAARDSLDVLFEAEVSQTVRATP